MAAPVVAEKYPLVFNSGARTNYDFRSQHHNIPSLVKLHPHPLVYIHEDDADERGIQDGDRCYVISLRGRVPFRARLTKDIVPGVVEVNMGGGGPLGPIEWQDANVNELTDAENIEIMTGFPVFKSLLCDVVKMEEN